jgi:hypothetical protein
MKIEKRDLTIKEKEIVFHMAQVRVPGAIINGYVEKENLSTEFTNLYVGISKILKVMNQHSGELKFNKKAKEIYNLHKNHTKEESYKEVESFLISHLPELLSLFEKDYKRKADLTEEMEEILYHLVNTDTPADIRNKYIADFEVPSKFPIYYAILSQIFKGQSPDDSKDAIAAKKILNKFKHISKFESLNAIKEFLHINYPVDLKVFMVQHLRKQYPMAYQRYKGISKRSFERTLSELFFNYYYQMNSFDFKYLRQDEDSDENSVKKEVLDKHNMKLIDSDLYIPTPKEFDNPLELMESLKIPLASFYKDMTKVQTFNTLKEYWIKQYLQEDNRPHAEKTLTILKRHVETRFGDILDFNKFSKEFFKEDDHDRCCKYCDIPESQIRELHEHGLIVTKRYYSRGKTMEVDQRDAFKGYTFDNIDLVCYWCNNAKTDEFTEDEFFEVGRVMKTIWQNRVAKLDKKKVA